MNLTFTVDNQRISRTDTNFIVADSRNYLTATFTFSDDWAGLAKTAIFRFNGGIAYNVVLDDDACSVPHECLFCGTMTVSVFAGDLLTTNECSVPIAESGLEYGITPQPSTPDVYNQILEKATNAEEIVEALKERADSGEFNGKSAVVEVGTTTTVEAGTAAAVNSTYDESTNTTTLNFEIPKGDKGDNADVDMDFDINSSNALANSVISKAFENGNCRGIRLFNTVADLTAMRAELTNSTDFFITLTTVRSVDGESTARKGVALVYQASITPLNYGAEIATLAEVLGGINYRIEETGFPYFVNATSAETYATYLFDTTKRPLLMRIDFDPETEAATADEGIATLAETLQSSDNVPLERGDYVFLAKEGGGVGIIQSKPNALNTFAKPKTWKLLADTTVEGTDVYYVEQSITEACTHIKMIVYAPALASGSAHLRIFINNDYSSSAEPQSYIAYGLNTAEHYNFADLELIEGGVWSNTINTTSLNDSTKASNYTPRYAALDAETISRVIISKNYGSALPEGLNVKIWGCVEK